MGLLRQLAKRRTLGISIHPSRVGWDAIALLMPELCCHFNPPIPCGMGHRDCWWYDKKGTVFQSTHPVWDGTCPHNVVRRLTIISIHPSRVGWDFLLRSFNHPLLISIHPSRVGWDLVAVECKPHKAHFNPPIPCGMGRNLQRCDTFTKNISIHPSRVGWDGETMRNFAKRGVFQSTHPVWDGTRRWTKRATCSSYFNPPIPCGMGLSCASHGMTSWIFQSTHPVWDGTTQILLFILKA